MILEMYSSFHLIDYYEENMYMTIDNIIDRAGKSQLNIYFDYVNIWHTSWDRKLAENLIITGSASN